MKILAVLLLSISERMETFSFRRKDERLKEKKSLLVFSVNTYDEAIDLQIALCARTGSYYVMVGFSGSSGNRSSRMGKRENAYHIRKANKVKSGTEKKPNPHEVSLAKFLRSLETPVTRGYIRLNNDQIVRSEPKRD